MAGNYDSILAVPKARQNCQLPALTDNLDGYHLLLPPLWDRLDSRKWHFLKYLLKTNVGEFQWLSKEALIKNGQCRSKWKLLNISEPEVVAPSENKAAKALTSVSHAKHSNSFTIYHFEYQHSTADFSEWWREIKTIDQQDVMKCKLHLIRIRE